MPTHKHFRFSDNTMAALKALQKALQQGQWHPPTETEIVSRAIVELAERMTKKEGQKASNKAVKS